jgi:hypothetical protein
MSETVTSLAGLAIAAGDNAVGAVMATAPETTSEAVAHEVAAALPSLDQPISQTASDAGSSPGSVSAFVALEQRVETIAALIAKYLPPVAAGALALASDAATLANPSADPVKRVTAVEDGVAQLRSAFVALFPNSI